MCGVEPVEYLLVPRSLATQVMTLMLMELLFAAISAYLLAGERMQLQEWIGGALIASASLLSGHIVAKPKPAAPPLPQAA